MALMENEIKSIIQLKLGGPEVETPVRGIQARHGLCAIDCPAKVTVQAQHPM